MKNALKTPKTLKKDNNLSMAKGGKTIAQTPAPKKDRIKGSSINNVGSAKDGKGIKLSNETINTLKNKLSSFKKGNPNKTNITLNDLKAVYRRGSGAYSTSHRPTISGGAPNTRAAWSIARVNKFLKKASGEKVKKAYVQDDDLMKYEKGGETSQKWYRKYKGDDPLAYNKEARTKYGSGIYFSSQPNSRFEGEKEIEVIVDYKNPKIYENTKTIPNRNFVKDWRKEYDEDEMNKFVDSLFDSGYDAIIVKHSDTFGDELIIRDKSLIKYKDGDLIAPNGKKSNLTEEQYKLVRTPQFKAWFGDWENDPQNASKVVDENGEPLVVYHTSTSQNEFYEFDKNYINNNDPDFWASGFWFAKDIENTSYWTNLGGSPFTKSFFLNIKKPLLEKDIDKYQNKYVKNNKGDKNREELIKNGYDGIEFEALVDIDKLMYEVNKLKENINITSTRKLKLFREGKELSYHEIENGIHINTIFLILPNGTIVDKDWIETQIKNFGTSGTFVVFEPNQIKLADGTNTTFDINNPDIRFENGGETKNIEMELTNSLSVSDIDNKYPTLPHPFINQQLMKGIEVEMEHTDNQEVARKIALDHLYENPFYYEYLDKMEEELKNLDIDAHYNELMQGSYYAKGGETSGYEFTTPTKLESKLPYLQQVLVRTKAFKNWFGDWELAARLYLADGAKNFKKHYANVSKVIDMETLEPSLVFHGTSSEEEFYQFATNKDTGSGRPYGYFAINREYSMNFVGRGNLLYSAFLNIRNPFMARGEGYDNRKQDWAYWALTIANQLIIDNIEKEGIKLDDLSQEEASELAKKYLIIVTSQIEDYIRKVYKNEDYNFWLLMARDVDSEFKRFLISHGYDGILANEQFKDPYDVNNPKEYTNTCIIFDATQVKLADGRNLTFDPMNADIRYEKGGEMHQEEDLSHSKKERMRKMAFGGMYKSGGALHNDEGVKDDAKEGGLFVGRSHANGGIKAYNVSTNSPIEVEGGEVIITKKAVSDDTKREFEGEMLTNKEILSRINESGGGVSFEDGGEIHGCGCSGKKFNYGGEVLEDYMIIKKMNELYDATMGKTISYADSLVNKLK